MGRVSNGKLVELWRERIGRQERSGLSIWEYCRREGVSAGSYYLWKRRLSQTAATEPGKTRGTRGGRRRPDAGARNSRRGFVEVAWTPSQAIEVCFVDGTVLRLPAHPLDALALTLKTLHVSRSEDHAHD
jgi:hypothetical protein